MELTRYYAGVGSRETPVDVLAEMRMLGRILAQHEFCLRSGAADGADAEFEAGALEVPNADMQIYLPWRGFKGHASPLYRVTAHALQIAASTHPAWYRLSQGQQKLHGRNCYQVLGLSLNLPAEFVACWTKDGCESARERSRNTGGTATAIVLAERHGIPVFNLARPGRRADLAAFLRKAGVELPPGTLREPAGPLALAL